MKALSDHKNANGWFSYTLESHFLLWCEGVCEINRLNCCGTEKHTITSADSLAAQMESHSTLTVPMQGSSTNTHQIKPWFIFFSRQRTDSLRCHFWQEPIISLSYCSFHFSAVVSLLFASVMWKSISARHVKDVSILEMQPEDREGGGEEAHWRSCERGCTFVRADVVFFCDRVMKYRQRERTFLCKCIHNHLSD